MKNITIIAIALMGVSVSACGDKAAKTQKALNADCSRVVVTMGDDLPANFCQCFSEKLVTALEPGELATVAAMFKSAQNEDDLDDGFENLSGGIKGKIKDIPDMCD